MGREICGTHSSCEDILVTDISEFRKGLDLEGAGRRMYEFITELYPICRSISGQGARETLALIKNRVPVVVHEVPTGTKVFDWTIPKEWNIKDAYIKDPSGVKIVDFKLIDLSYDRKDQSNVTGL